MYRVYMNVNLPPRLHIQCEQGRRIPHSNKHDHPGFFPFYKHRSYNL